MRCVVSCGSTSFPWLCFLLWNSAVRVYDSQAYRKMDVTRECISCIFELREILLSVQTGFSLVDAAVVCAIQCRPLTRRQLCPPDKRSKQQHMSFEFMVRSAQPPKALCHCFRKQHVHMLWLHYIGAQTTPRLD